MKSSPIAALLALAIAVAPLTGAHPQVALPALGDAAAGDMGVNVERRLGDQVMREIRRDPDYLDDPVLLDYVQSLWAPLMEVARRRGEISPEIASAFAFETFLIRDRSVNAFALPGGFVGVFLGLMAMTGSADELASVLAHELSHVTQRHIARGSATAQRQSLVGMAAMIIGLMAANRARNSDMAQAAIIGTQAALAQAQLNYSRDMEREADRIGFSLFAGAGYAPGGVVAMFEKLDHQHRLNDSGAFPYLRSHPLTTERIGEARDRVAAFVPTQAPISRALEHSLMQARARVLMDANVGSFKRHQAAPAPTSLALGERLGVLYATALSSLLLDESDKALAALQPALRLLEPIKRQEPRAWRSLVLLQAQALSARGDGAGAAQQLATLAGDSRVELFARSELTLARVRAGERSLALRPSVEALQTWVADHKDDALAWSLLAQAAELDGQPLRAVRAQAEARAAQGDLQGAIDRLRSGQRLARAAISPDFVEASIIDARVRVLEAQWRQRLRELRGERVFED